jgi:hypothetical protein
MEPSWIASHICTKSIQALGWECWTYGLRASLQDGCAIEVPVVLDGVAVLDDAFGATEGRRGAAVSRQLRVGM